MNGKMYFARFTLKSTQQVDFYKFGHTSSYDAMDRFTYEPVQYNKWDIRIMKTVYGPLEQMKGVEETFKAMYPKNVWINENISGVTEIVKLSEPQVQRVIECMSKLNTVYFKKREREKLSNGESTNEKKDSA